MASPCITLRTQSPSLERAQHTDKIAQQLSAFLFFFSFLSHLSLVEHSRRNLSFAGAWMADAHTSGNSHFSSCCCCFFSINFHGPPLEWKCVCARPEAIICCCCCCSSLCRSQRRREIVLKTRWWKKEAFFLSPLLICTLLQCPPKNLPVQ